MGVEGQRETRDAETRGLGIRKTVTTGEAGRRDGEDRGKRKWESEGEE